jgi:DNA-binding SARP family transcriptional activator
VVIFGIRLGAVIPVTNGGPVRPIAERPAAKAGGECTIRPILRIQTFGGLRAWLGDEPLALPPSRQSRALLAYLACAYKPSHRAGLCELLWNDSPEPRAALRWCLSKLRPVLDAGGTARLVAEDDNVWIPEHSCEVDGKRLRELAAGSAGAETAALEEAVTRCVGPFLSDLDVADAYRFESWKASEEKALEESRARIFAELLARHKDSPEASVRIGHLWAQQDPFQPQAHIAIIEALTALGPQARGPGPLRTQRSDAPPRRRRLPSRPGKGPHGHRQAGRRTGGQARAR